jgi:hypothetical protein
VRVMVPAPHEALHWSYSDHCDTQSTGQLTSALQSRASALCGQLWPPSNATLSMARPRVCRPVAHVLEHAVQLLQEDMTQSTGHGELLHVPMSSRFWHALPPCAGAMRTVRVRFHTPPPQLLSQAPQPE